MNVLTASRPPQTTSVSQGVSPPIPARVILAAHLLVTGPAQELHRYLLPRVESLLYLHHPLQPFTPVGDHRSVIQRFIRGRLVHEGAWALWSLPHHPAVELLLFAWHAWLTIWWGLTRGRGADLWIGINPLNVFAGVILKRLGAVRQVIGYTIDYVPQRFAWRWVNRLYHWIDRTGLQGCDQMWNLSSRMVGAREADGVPATCRAKQITVPIGTDLRVMPKPLAEVERHTMVYFGGLMEKQGVQLGIQALAFLRPRVPEARLLIVGGGQPARRQMLEQLADSLGIADAVEFTGIIEDHDEALRRLAGCAVAIAPYTDDPDNFTQYTDPGKPKAYLAAGLPVVMTGVPEVAHVIEQAGAGVVVPYHAEALAKALVPFLTDDGHLTLAKAKARTLAEQYEWVLLFDRAFAQRPVI